jgi:hypothetical protein
MISFSMLRIVITFSLVVSNAIANVYLFHFFLLSTIGSIDKIQEYATTSVRNENVVSITQPPIK